MKQDHAESYAKGSDGRRFNQKYTLLVALALLAGAGGWFALHFFVPGHNSAPSQNEEIPHTAPQTVLQTNSKSQASEPEPLKQGALDLAMKTITLSQGEGGIELWRLKAEWASLHRQEDTVVVTQPRLTYFLKEEGKILYVQSARGDIDQKSQILRFVDNVQISQDAKRLRSALLVYNGNDKTMTLPQGGDFSDTGIDGTADFLLWHIDSKRIEAEGRITVHFEVASPEPAASDSLSESHPEREGKIPHTDTFQPRVE